MTKYYELVLKIISENRTRHPGDGYFRHHIFPRSIYPLLKHKDWNIIFVTYSEHKMLHEYLAEITVGRCQAILKDDLRYF